MERRGFFYFIGAMFAGLFTGKAIADLPSVGTVPVPAKHWFRALSADEVLVLYEREPKQHTLNFVGVSDYVDVQDTSFSLSDSFTVLVRVRPTQGFVKGKENEQDG